MIEKIPLIAHRVRKINGSFAFIEHRFLRDGFFASLNHHELLLYVFLIIVGDRRGMSFYSYDKICTLLRVSVDEYIAARNSLIEKDLIAFDGRFFQVLSLPDNVVNTSCPPLKDQEEMERHDPATVHQLIVSSLGGDHD
ncbi:hypothetical protein CEE45_17140 [Candidatus Heimdallarchaeota archaeon B3_Heim]|nr:MAG: hypothetical protein CEE45_17140 [Candidatus Heimdallarchaeota archaeon B3_Heim]